MKQQSPEKKISFIAGVVGIIILGITAFIFGNAKDVLFGSSLSVTTIKDGATFVDGFLPIQGIAKHAKNIAVNGRSLFVDREGNFADGVILSPGYNVIEVALLDQFGNQKVKTYHLVLDETDTVAQVRKPLSNFYHQ
jgi:uncharacterized protein YfaP (DUF2135 family)